MATIDFGDNNVKTFVLDESGGDGSDSAFTDDDISRTALEFHYA